MNNKNDKIMFLQNTNVVFQYIFYTNLKKH